MELVVVVAHRAGCALDVHVDGCALGFSWSGVNLLIARLQLNSSASKHRPVPTSATRSWMSRPVVAGRARTISCAVRVAHGPRRRWAPTCACSSVRYPPTVAVARRGEPPEREASPSIAIGPWSWPAFKPSRSHAIPTPITFHLDLQTTHRRHRQTQSAREWANSRTDDESARARSLVQTVVIRLSASNSCPNPTTLTSSCASAKLSTWRFGPGARFGELGRLVRAPSTRRARPAVSPAPASFVQLLERLGRGGFKAARFGGGKTKTTCLPHWLPIDCSRASTQTQVNELGRLRPRPALFGSDFVVNERARATAPAPDSSGHFGAQWARNISCGRGPMMERVPESRPGRCGNLLGRERDGGNLLMGPTRELATSLKCAPDKGAAIRRVRLTASAAGSETNAEFGQETPSGAAFGMATKNLDYLEHEKRWNFFWPQTTLRMAVQRKTAPRRRLVQCARALFVGRPIGYWSQAAKTGRLHEAAAFSLAADQRPV